MSKQATFLGFACFDIFNIIYPEMHKVQGAKFAISRLMYDLPVCTDDKLVRDNQKKLPFRRPG